jgi:hypothetical protein
MNMMRLNRPMSAYGAKRTSVAAPHMSAFGGKADIVSDRAGNAGGITLARQHTHPRISMIG